MKGKKILIPKDIWFSLLNPYERAILMVLYSLKNPDSVSIIPSLSFLSVKTYIGRKGLSKYISSLEKKSILIREGKGRYKLYVSRRNIEIPNSLAVSKLYPHERAYLGLIWSLIPLQGDGNTLYANVRDFVNLLGVCERSVRIHLNHLCEKGLIHKERYSNFLRIKPLFPPV